jgi:lysozyme
MTAGIDVSNHQVAIDWTKVASFGIEFALIKATEGTTFRDPSFAANWSAAKANGLARGAYHFPRADLGTNPRDEADHFLAIVGSQGLDVGDLLALDIEDSPGSPQPADLLDWVSTWLAHVRANVGFRPLIYSTAGYLAGHNLTNKAELGEHGMWLASWFNTRPTTFPAPPAGWPLVAVHQWTSKGSVPGIAGLVDLDLFNGPIDRFRLYGKLAPTPMPANRAVLDAWFAAWKAGREAFSAAEDLVDWDSMIPALNRLKARHGIA